MRRFYLAILVVIFAQNLVAQEAGKIENTELLQFYDNELFHWNTGGFGLALNYKHLTSSIAWGIDPTMKEALSTYPDTKTYVDSYSKLDLSGNILMWGGLAITLVGVFIPIMSGNMFTSNNGEISTGTKVMYGGFIGGYVSMFTGSILSIVGQRKLFQGITAFNRHKVEEF
jgi:hypothetical protein